MFLLSTIPSMVLTKSRLNFLNIQKYAQSNVKWITITTNETKDFTAFSGIIANNNEAVLNHL